MTTPLPLVVVVVSPTMNGDVYNREAHQDVVATTLIMQNPLMTT